MHLIDMITLNTILYENNFNELLSEGSWFFRFNSKFISEKCLTINNIISTNTFLEKINNLKSKFNFKLIHVDEHKDKSIKQHNLNINGNTLGFDYTIPYFVAIDNIDTKYILNIASDCMHDIFVDDEYLKDSIYELDNNPLCLTTMVSWIKNNEAKNDGITIPQYQENEYFKTLNISETYNNKFNHSLGFTDQFFMGTIDKLKLCDFNVDKSICSIIYHGPDYGGECFEKRITGHNIKNRVYNLIYKGNQYFIHDNRYW